MLPSVLPTETDHVPVLADEVVAALSVRPGETVVDATFGAGGHASLLAARLEGEGKLIAIDRDPEVAQYFERFRRRTNAKTRLLHGEFSYAVDAPLDMRMDPSAGYSARELVNEAPEQELADIFKRYGEERYARQVARAIVRRRQRQPFERTAELVEAIKGAIPAPARFGDGHPAKRVF